MSNNEYFQVRQVEPIGHSMWRGFLIGVASGLGAVIGATIVLGTILFILSRLDFVPFIGSYIAEITNYINEHNPHR